MLKYKEIEIMNYQQNKQEQNGAKILKDVEMIKFS